MAKISNPGLLTTNLNFALPVVAVLISWLPMKTH